MSGKNAIENKSVHAIENKDLSLPEPKCYPFRVVKVPSVFIGDDAFALKEYMMKPFPQAGLTEDKRVYDTGIAVPGEYLRMCLESFLADGVYFVLRLPWLQTQ